MRDEGADTASTDVTLADLAPLLEGTYSSPRAAFVALQGQRRLIQAALRMLLNRQRGQRLAFDDATEFVHAVLVELVSRIQEKEGLPLPPEGDLHNPGAWLRSVVYRQGQTLLRGERTTRRGALDKADSLFHVGADDADPSDQLDRLAAQPAPEMAAIIDLKRRFAGQLARLDACDLPPQHKLVWVLHLAPHLLSAELVLEASRYTGGDEGGAARSPAETHDLLVSWLDRHQDRPDVNEARRELAWILRSTDKSGPASWAAADPAAVRRARDTVRQWLTRARQRLDEGGQ